MVSEARLTIILDTLSKTAEDALSSRDLSDKTKKKIERVCRLAKSALDQQPTRLTASPSKTSKRQARSSKT